MKMLVCVSNTPDTTSKISFTDQNTKFNTTGVQYIMNPYDEWYALVRAIELKEKLGGTVSLIHVGTASADQSIRKGLAIGADDAYRVDVEPQSALYVAKQIAAHARTQNYDLVFCGKETIDFNGSEIGAMVAELLDLPFVSYAMQLDMNGDTATIAREIEGGKEIVEVKTPFVLSAAKGLAEQRIPNMQGIMMSKRKPLNVIPASSDANHSTIARYELPDGKTTVRMIAPENMDELVRLLHEEAKVI